MTERRVQIIPPRQRCNTPRWDRGTRLEHEHDMNDAINARLDWVDKSAGRAKTMEELAANRTKQKQEEDERKNQSGKFQLFLLILALSPLIAMVEWFIIKRIFGF